MTSRSDVPGDWRFDRWASERTQAIAAFGLTERQARFLVEVMIHSGVFVERQYCRFAGIVHGQKTHDFLRKLVERGHARPIQVGSLHRGRLFHVSHKPLYAAIGQADNRHRKSMPIGRMVERLMVLDAVLADRSFTWLGTEQDKRTHFLTHLQGRVTEDDFPRITFGSGKASTRRYFPDKLPIGIQPNSDDHVFIHLTTKPMPDDFRVFLQRHAALLGLLRKWTIQVLVPQPLASAIPRFGHLRSSRVLCLDDGKPITRQGAWSRVRYAAIRANVPTGVHILRHTFCSHLVMRGAAMRAVQELVGHQDLTMTQRYSHLSPAALVDTIRLLESRVAEPGRGEILETAEGRDRKLKR